jgi:diguanylate cyclase
MFASGVLLGALLLVAGLWIGHWMARRSAPPLETENLSDYHLVHLLRNLFQWTDGFASDVSAYRETVDQVCQRFTALEGEKADDEKSMRKMLAQIVEANNGLKMRLEKAEAALQDQAQEIAGYMSEARTDSLTGLPNRRTFDDELTRRMAEFRRYQTPVSLILVDIDFFKKFNDTYGHLAGDAVLQQVAQVLRDTMRESDLVVRLGGEEFAVILPSSEGENVWLAAERTRMAIDGTGFRYKGKDLRVSVSCGAAQALGQETVTELVRRADEALYAAKGAGRNCAHWHDGQRLMAITPNREDDPRVDLQRGSEFGKVCQDLRERLLTVVGEEVAT